MNIEAIKKHLKEIENLLCERDTKNPFSLGRHIPGFRPLRDGEEWHFTADEWKEGDLEEGWRPVLRGEQYKAGDMKWCAGFGPWSRCEEDGPDGGLEHGHTRFKTLRPLPEPKKRVPLGPSDIRPGNVFRYKNMREGLWAAPSEVGHDGLLFWSYKEDGTEGESYHVSWEKLMSYERSNDGINWTPCYREE